jgi:RNA polymerase sigma-70 factor, ECF subfamily
MPPSRRVSNDTKGKEMGTRPSSGPWTWSSDPVPPCPVEAGCARASSGVTTSGRSTRRRTSIGMDSRTGLDWRTWHLEVVSSLREGPPSLAYLSQFAPRSRRLLGAPLTRLPTRCPAHRFPMDGNFEVEVASLLRRLGSGDNDASQRLLALLYVELHELAARCMKGQPPDHTLQATALVHEAYLRMNRKSGRRFEDKTRFMAFAVKAMRCVLVDHARRKHRDKRTPPAQQRPLDQIVVTYEEHALDLVALDEALSRLAEFDEVMAKAVELRFFGGLDMQEIATHLGVKKRTLERQWKATRAWLLQEVSTA